MADKKKEKPTLIKNKIGILELILVDGETADRVPENESWSILPERFSTSADAVIWLRKNGEIGITYLTVQVGGRLHFEEKQVRRTVYDE